MDELSSLSLAVVLAGLLHGSGLAGELFRVKHIEPPPDCKTWFWPKAREADGYWPGYYSWEECE